MKLKKRFILPELGTVESGNGTASSRAAIHFCLHSVAIETAESSSPLNRPCPKIPQLSIGVNNWDFEIGGKFTPSIKDNNVYFSHSRRLLNLWQIVVQTLRKNKALDSLCKDAALTSL